MQIVQNTSTQSPQYRDLPLAQLFDSPTNPRQRYDPTSLEELAQSFRSRGVLEPLLVRPVEAAQFEIVAESRRFRAAQLAEPETVPARVREMTDAEALEVQCVENLQREGIYSLERPRDFGPGWSSPTIPTRWRLYRKGRASPPRTSPAD